MRLRHLRAVARVELTSITGRVEIQAAELSQGGVQRDRPALIIDQALVRAGHVLEKLDGCLAHLYFSFNRRYLWFTPKILRASNIRGCVLGACLMGPRGAFLSAI